MVWKITAKATNGAVTDGTLTDTISGDIVTAEVRVFDTSSHLISASDISYNGGTGASGFTINNINLNDGQTKTYYVVAELPHTAGSITNTSSFTATNVTSIPVSDTDHFTLQTPPPTTVVLTKEDIEFSETHTATDTSNIDTTD